MEQIFISLLLTSTVGTAIAVLLTLIKPLTRKIFSVSWQYYIWLVVLLIMMLPVRISINDTYIKSSVKESMTVTETAPEVIKNNIPVKSQHSKISNEEITPVLQQIKTVLIDNRGIVTRIWLAVAIILIFVNIAGYIAFLVKIKRNSKEIECSELKLYTVRSIRTRVSDKISSPFIIGMIRPMLILPNSEMTQTELGNILAHEMTHLNRHDILYKWFLLLVKCVHWFNPAVYYISRQISTYCEISCDLTATKLMNEQQKNEYLNTILSLMSDCKREAASYSTGMTGKKALIKKRFIMIKQGDRVGRVLRFVSGIVASVIAVTALTANAVLIAAIDEDDNVDTPYYFVWPTDVRTVSGKFGTRIHPITFEEKTHNGIDIVAPENAEVYSSIDGVVTETGFDKQKGNYVVIENEQGVKVNCCHLSDIEVSIGDNVLQNEIIGKVGNTGEITGIALHFEIEMNDKFYNPELLLPQADFVKSGEKTSTPADIAIKSTTVADEAYIGFEQTVIDNADMQRIESELLKYGITMSNSDAVDLSYNYTVGDYSYHNEPNRTDKRIKCDENGNISVYFSVSSNNLTDVNIYDSETNEAVGEYTVLANNKNVYTFLGFDTDRAYTVEIKSKTQDDWKVEGKYIIY
ncbi:MAG: M23/M56 family metallopeptidase [Clostridia bacterium]|nr:M23/M56 family metallopeptidase [Clostridia bacterium]